MALRFTRQPLLFATLLTIPGLSVYVPTSVGFSQDDDRAFKERLRKAAEAQKKQNEADQIEQKRLSSSFAAERREMRVQDEHELRQMEIDFREKHRSLKEEQTRREQELKAQLRGDEAKLSESLDNLKALMTVKEAYSQWKFDRRKEAFSQKVKSDVAEQLAKAEAERERKKQIAIAAVMAYFTGGASLAAMGPALAGGAGSNATPKPSNASTAGSSSPAAAIPIGTASSKVKTQSLGRAGAAKPPITAKTAEAPDKARSGVKVYDTPAGPPIRPPIDDPGVYPDWLDPIGFIVSEGVSAARGIGGLFKGGPKPPPALPPVPNRIYSARELGRSAEEAGAYHNFPAQFDKYVFEGTRKVVSDEYVLFTRPGTLNGRPGVFEMGVKPSLSGGVEVIKHRFFRPDGPPALP
jgi:hypothetical protein